MQRLATLVKAAAASALFLLVSSAAPLAGIGSDATVYGKTAGTNPDRDVLDATAYGKTAGTNPDRDVLD